MKTKLIKKIMALTIATITVIGMPAVGASASWRQNNNGWWNSKGNDYSVGWDRIGDNWFYFNQNGYMKTGWLQDGDKWYFLNPNGNMKTGWLQDGNKWYFLNANGDMAHDITINIYKLGPDGAWINDNLTYMNTTSTTSAAVVVPIDNINTISTTSAAVTIPNDDNDNSHLHKYNNQKDKLENLMDKYNKKLDKKAQKIEKKVGNAWQFLHR